MPLSKRGNPKCSNFSIGSIKSISDFGTSQLEASWMLTCRLPRSLMSSNDEPNPDQCVPAWTGFNIMSMNDIPKLSSIGYCPVINASPTDYSVVYTTLDLACKITRKIGQSHTILVLDQAIYCKALEIVEHKKDESKDLILCLGGFHILMAFLGTIGK